ncbi:nitroreductase family protein, partial [Bacteroides sp. OttesenSCG-928-F21]|nr:nitroreductase family protein [Bacteroides sp. OttesenSCG-928-F21]
AETWNLPKEWKLMAQMPFGTPIAQPGEKEFESLAKRVKVFK